MHSYAHAAPPHHGPHTTVPTQELHMDNTLRTYVHVHLTLERE